MALGQELDERESIVARPTIGDKAVGPEFEVGLPRFLSFADKRRAGIGDASGEGTGAQLEATAQPQ